MLELELIPVVGVYMVSLIYGHNTNIINTSYELTISDRILQPENDS